MFKKILDYYESWKFQKEFEKKKQTILKADPFIYEIPSETHDHSGPEPTRYQTWENKGKEIDF